MKTLIISAVILLLLGIFFYPKVMNEGQECYGKKALLENKHNPFSYIPEEVAERIEIESIYQVCFGIPLVK